MQIRMDKCKFVMFLCLIVTGLLAFCFLIIPSSSSRFSHLNFEDSILKPVKKSNISGNKALIKEAAFKNHIPPELIAGIIWNETDLLNFIVDKQLEILGNANVITEPTVGLAQVSPVSSLVERQMGFNPDQYKDLVMTYYKNINKNEPDSTEIINVQASTNKIKASLRNYYSLSFTPNDISILEKTFNKVFTEDKKAIKLEVFNERSKQSFPEYNIKYLANLLSRVKIQKYAKRSDLSDAEMGEIAKQYNAGMGNILVKKPYFQTFKDALPLVREWLK